MFVFQLCDGQADNDGYSIHLESLRIAKHCPVLLDHSREKILGRLVKAWRAGGRITGQVEFADTPSGICAQYATQQGSLSHVSPLFLFERSETRDGITTVHDAVIVEVTLTSPAGEPKAIRNVLLSQPTQVLRKPGAAVWWQANRFHYDKAAVQTWLEAHAVTTDGIAIDERAHTWSDPILQPV